MISTIKDIFEIEELKTRIQNTILFLVIFRLGTHILLPGLDYDIIAASQGNAQGVLGFIDNFLGGAFSNKSIFGLGIMPYISASIVLQLMQVAVPYFQRLQKEGESGRKKITQITRVLTIAICAVQSFGFLATIDANAIIINPVMFKVTSILILISGTMFCMWLGEKITEKGIGNGVSMLIMIGIISRLPSSIAAEFVSRDVYLFIVIELVVFFVIVMGVVMLTQATRRIPISYAKQIVDGKVYGGQRQYVPLKVNAAGVMPIIFAQALMFLPAMLANIWEKDSDLASSIGKTFSNPFSWQYSLLFALLIIVFTFFYTAITINPNQIADDLKRSGGFVPGVKPGEQTAEYIDAVLSKITLPGAVFIAIVAILPAFANLANVSSGFAQFYGGTSLLIMVGVVLDTIQQINSYLLMREYDGMMKSGKLKDRGGNISVA
ncbi:MAG: preprotein translocase subunit SecY [Cytophagales bacterium]|nr:preprotein translocase subunit SecY [Cytophagales bacterium]